MSDKRILILDYTPEKTAAAAIRRWLPGDAQTTALFINTEDSFPNDLAERDFTHVIHSGSSLSITETAPFTNKAAEYIRHARDHGVAQFGICYGHQLICLALVGKQAVRASPKGMEAGWENVMFTDHAMDVFGVGKNEVVWHSHFDEVTAPPDGSILLATTAHTPIQAYIHYGQRILGTQFHPEFDKEAGDKIYLDSRDLLKANGFNVDEVIDKKPTIDAGKMLFGYFCSRM